MSKYTFEPMTRLRLEVERDPKPGEQVNLIPNPSAELGAWGWTSPLVGSYVHTGIHSGLPSVEYVTGAGAGNEFYTLVVPVTPGEDLRARWDLMSAPTSGYRARFRWYDFDGNAIAPSVSDDLTTSAPGRTSIRTVPAGVAFAALTFRVTNADFTDYTSAGAVFAVRRVKVFSSRFGALTDAAMTANADAPEVLWENVLGPTLELTVKREEFDLGTLTATILDATIDPAVASTIRPGRRVRLTALTEPVTGTFEPLFTGTVDTASVTYDLRNRKASDPKHARISLTAVDGMQVLGSTPRREGVDFVHELPDVLESKDGGGLEALPLPWDCDGVTGHIPGATLTSTNDNATAADQVALTRDGNLGYAWIDRRGVVMARSVLPATVDYTFDEAVYSELDLSFDPRRLINSLDVHVLTYDSGTGETSEVVEDPVVDARSIRTWGKRHRSFTMTWGQLARFADFPATVFAANATPKVQPLSVTIPVLTDPDRAARAFVDIYDLVRLMNTDKAIDEQLRVTSVQHRISTDKWLMDVGFAGDSTVAIPQRQPTR